MMIKAIIFLLCAIGPLGSLAIFGGTPASVGQFPFMVSVISTETTDHEPRLRYVLGTTSCGGTILSSRLIATDSNQWILVIAGDINQSLETLEVRQGRQIGLVEKILIHSEYNGHQLGFNDIALLVLSKPLELNEFVFPIRVSEPGQVFKGDAMICGWERTGQESDSDILLTTKVGIMDSTECMDKTNELLIDIYNKVLANLPAPTPTRLEAVSQICTISGGGRPCKGDSGGPLLCYTDSDTQPYLCGIASWGWAGSGSEHTVLCALSDNPAMFTAVVKYTDWIKLKLNEFPTNNESGPGTGVECDNDNRKKALDTSNRTARRRISALLKLKSFCSSHSPAYLGLASYCSALKLIQKL